MLQGFLDQQSSADTHSHAMLAEGRSQVRQTQAQAVEQLPGISACQHGVSAVATFSRP